MTTADARPSVVGHLVRGLLVAAAIFAVQPVAGAFDKHHVVGVVAAAGCLAIAVLGMDLILGVGHQFHLGQAVFLAIGAYGFAILHQDVGLPALLAAALAVLVVGVVGFVVGWVFFKLGALLFAVGTLAIGVIGLNAIVRLGSVTGGSDGKTLQRVEPLFGLERGTWSLLLVAVLLGVGVVLTRVYATGARGRLLRTVGMDPVMASSLGIDVRMAKVEAMTIASLLAGVGGVCLAMTSRVIAPGTFSLETSIVLVVAVVVGRPGSIVGPVLALIVLEVLPEFLPVFSGRFDLLIGALLVVVMILGGGEPRSRRRAGDAGQHDEAPEAAPTPEAVHHAP